MHQKETENKGLYEPLENVKKNNSNLKQTDLQGNDFIKENTKTGISQAEKPLKRSGARFLDSIMESGPFIQKAVKLAAIGAVIGFVFSLLFPPFGIAIMAISAIACVTAIGTKVGHSYTNIKSENSHAKEHTETKAEIPGEVVGELMEQKLSKDKIKQEEKKNSINDDSKQNIETSTESTIKK